MNTRTVIAAVAVLAAAAACGYPTASPPVSDTTDTEPGGVTGNIGEALTLDGEVTITVTDVELSADNDRSEAIHGAWGTAHVSYESHKNRLFVTASDFDIATPENMTTEAAAASSIDGALTTEPEGIRDGAKREGLIAFDIDPTAYADDHGTITYTSFSGATLTWEF